MLDSIFSIISIIHCISSHFRIVAHLQSISSFLSHDKQCATNHHSRNRHFIYVKIKSLYYVLCIYKKHFQSEILLKKKEREREREKRRKGVLKLLLSLNGFAYVICIIYATPIEVARPERVKHMARVQLREREFILKRACCSSKRSIRPIHRL